MKIEIPDELLKQNHLTESDLKLEIALLLYQRHVFTLGQASNFAGLHQLEMQGKLKEHNIYLNYDLESFREDLNTLNEP
jgi:predicted HTH domain antitoxin